jgi:uncharacterized protein
MGSLDEKYEGLRRFIREKGKGGVVVALSGGVDSSTLAAVCHDVLGKRAIAVTAKSPTYPPEEMDEAKRIAKEIGIEHYIVETYEMADENFIRNPENRCYYCKKELLNRLHDVARGLGFMVVFEGTNLSDLGGHRPGFKAIEETDNAFSPWVENEFSKEEIRTLAKKMGLSFYDKPSLPCLASRIPFGEQISEDRLNRIRRAEQLIKKIVGVRQVRVRDHNGLARIEVGRDERELFLNIGIMDKVAVELKKLGFRFVSMDLEGYRTGSMLATLKTT